MNKTVLRDIILVAAVVIIAAVLLIVFNINKSDGAFFEITVNGETYGKYSLFTNQVIDVEGICKVSVKNGEVFMLSSTCKGGDCVKCKPISKSGQTIICLPNGVVIRVLGSGEADAII